MTLREWEDQSPVRGQQHWRGAYVIPDALPPSIRKALWYLDDFIVTSVSGGAIWLVPKGEKT